MNVILIKALQLMLCLSLMVVLHEGGHFGFAKLFKTRVTRFYLFANWGFHLFSTYDDWFRRLLRKPLLTKRTQEGHNLPALLRNAWYRLTGRPDRVRTDDLGNKAYDDAVGTEYGIGWLPIGGYVAIDGMIDETNRKLGDVPQPWEFRSKPVWQRLLIMLGGVLMNLLTAFVVYSGIMYFAGEDRLPMENVTRGFAFNPEAEALGFRDGDIPVRADGKPLGAWSSQVLRELTQAATVTVLRQQADSAQGRREVELTLPASRPDLLHVMKMQPPFIAPISLALVDSVRPGGPAAQAGMAPQARLLAVDGTDIRYWNDYDELFLRRQDVLSMKDCSRADSLRLRSMQLVYLNPGAAAPDTVALRLDEDYMMGVIRHTDLLDYDIQHVDYTLLTCLPAGLRLGWNTLANYVGDMKYVASREGAQEVGSFIAIGNLFPETWDWLRFWMMTAMLSIVLAVMNILPIPGLDGGHVVILLYEALTGRQPSERVMLWLEYIGMGCLLALMLLAFGNDIRRFIL